jgi:hypothetical protein
MPRNRFDHLAKQIGQEALAASGTTVAHDEITAETQYADLRHEPDPACHAERQRMGLLGRLASEPCLLEVYSHAPSGDEFRACLAKHLASWQGRARKARTANRKRSEQGQAPAGFVDSFLWIIAAGAPTKLLTRLKLKASPDWPSGVYLFGGDILRVGLIVASELPRDATTLLVRLMAAGPLLAPALKEVAALPVHAYERVVAERVLLAFQYTLEQEPSQNTEEQELVMDILKGFENAHTEGLAQGLAQGLTEGRAHAVLAVLRVRGITVPDAARERILSQKDLPRLDRWLERAITATSIADVLDDPS